MHGVGEKRLKGSSGEDEEVGGKCLQWEELSVTLKLVTKGQVAKEMSCNSIRGAIRRTLLHSSTGQEGQTPLAKFTGL